MSNKPQKLYEVSGSGGRKLHTYANNSGQAKRIYCKEYGLRANDYWCGVRALTARALKPDEEKVWLEQAGERRATYVFIKGMLDICTKAHADVNAVHGGI